MNPILKTVVSALALALVLGGAVRASASSLNDETGAAPMQVAVNPQPLPPDHGEFRFYED